ncbi:magnesium-translocating P-type ATPase [Nostocales cyanobacterium HT-58-2]|nr:magnesium-translocating P-type ATPase [Nostocales cyanobacterium HT-58-2]
MNKQRIFWSIPMAELLQQLQSTPQGLTTQAAKQRLEEYGANLLKPKKKSDTLTLLLAQFQSPIILILIAAAILSIFLNDKTDALIILIIVLVSGLLGFWQERGAADAIEKLLLIVQIKANVLRDGKSVDILVEEIVPGDVVCLAAGDNIPGDCIILDSKDLFVNEAALTGETYPVAKVDGVLPLQTPLSQRTNTLFMGTYVVSGTAKALVVGTGKETEFGKVSQRLKFRPPETEFEHGVRQFGYFLMEVTLLLVLGIFAGNLLLKRPVLDSFLFALALAVGLTPQLLPAIISINLAHGAKQMAHKSVIVKRLAAIENFGSMNVLCSDKTGTLTEGVVRIHSAVDYKGNESDRVLFYAYLNAIFETGFVNPIDQAIRSDRTFDISGYQKLDEVPYDFIRKRLSILVAKDHTQLVISKGALQSIINVCSFVETGECTIVELNSLQAQIQQRFEALGQEGFRVLGVAYRNPTTTTLSKEDESDMTFLGYLVFFDPPKPGIIHTITELKQAGVSLKIITGDSHAVAASLSQQIGLSQPKILAGLDLHEMSDEALMHQVNLIDVFAEVEPNQKEDIILALKKAGNVVGYMGDGINDASALHAADVGISVNSAVDVAKEAADIVLLEQDLDVLLQGIGEGRITFANTLKYVFMATSANFGNMFSMAGASLLLPFFPLLPKQILLTNLMTDFPEMTIATDRVDQEMVKQPHRWDIKFIRNFMIVFGMLSSVFDYLTFCILLLILHSTPNQFRTGWFMESVISASMIVLVIRTRQPFFQSKPGKYLLIATITIGIVTLLLPFTPLAKLFGFQPLPISFILALGVIVALYITAAEKVKQKFYRQIKF